MSDAPPLAPSASYAEVIGATLVVTREERGVLQWAVAEAVGVSGSTWSRIERGKSALAVDQLARAAAALGVTPGAVASRADAAARALRGRGVAVVNIRESAEEAMGNGRVPIDDAIVLEAARSAQAEAADGGGS